MGGPPHVTAASRRRAWRAGHALGSLTKHALTWSASLGFMFGCLRVQAEDQQCTARASLLWGGVADRLMLARRHRRPPQFPYYTFIDRGRMYTVGSLFYAIYFFVSFPMFYRIDEYPQKRCGGASAGAAARGRAGTRAVRHTPANRKKESPSLVAKRV